MSASVSGAYASAHLPECTLPKGWGDCICGELRACEQRAYALGIEVGKHDGWLAGRAAGVVAARDAVAAIPAVALGWAVLGDDALAAIDALTPDPHRTHRDDGVQWCEECTDTADDNRPTPCVLHRARGQRLGRYRPAEMAYRHGFADGVAAAREAVAAVDPNAPGGNMDYGVNVQRRALDAIDALAPDPHRAHREDGVQWCEDCADDTDDRPTPCELHRAQGQRWCRDCYADAEAEARGDREREGR